MVIQASCPARTNAFSPSLSQVNPAGSPKTSSINRVSTETVSISKPS